MVICRRPRPSDRHPIACLGLLRLPLRRTSLHALLAPQPSSEELVAPPAGTPPSWAATRQFVALLTDIQTCPCPKKASALLCERVTFWLICGGGTQARLPAEGATAATFFWPMPPFSRTGHPVIVPMASSVPLAEARPKVGVLERRRVGAHVRGFCPTFFSETDPIASARRLFLSSSWTA